MRLPLLLSCLIALALAQPLHAQEMDTLKSDVQAKEKGGQQVVIADSLPERVIGKADAPVTLIEYASLTCGHCAHFHKEILPKLKEKYIDTGKVKLVYRDFPLDALALKAAQLTQCMPGDRYFPFLKTLFETQENWAKSADVDVTLIQYAKLAGMAGEKAAQCLADKKLQEALVKRRMEAEKQFQIDATPSFVINYGPEKLTGAAGFDDFEKALLDRVKELRPAR